MNGSIRKARWLSVGILLTTCLQISSALGQDGRNAEPDGVRPMEQVIVTAQRRAANAQDVPISLTVVDREFIESREIATLMELSRYVPNLTLNSSSQEPNTRINIRGVGSVGNSAIEPSVGVFIDGVYIPKPGSIIGDLIDIDRAEILRGPQGTNFGRNTPVGALNIVTAEPSAQSTAEVFAGIGTFQQVFVGGILGGAISPELNGRISIRASDRDGYGNNGYTDRDVGQRKNLSMRGKLGFDLGDRLRLVLAGDTSRLQTGGPTVEVLNSTSTDQFTGTVEALFGSSPVTVDSFDHDIFQDHMDDLDDEQWGLSATLDYELANGMELTSITAFRDWEATNRDSTIRITADILPRVSLYRTQTRSQELHLKSAADSSLEFLAGLFLYDEDYDIGSNFDAGTDFCIPVIFGLTLQQTGNPALAQAQAQFCLAQSQQDFIVSWFSQSLTSAALFGNLTWNVGERAAFSLGARWTDDSKDADFRQLVHNSFGFLFRQPEATLGLERDDTNFTWSASGRYFLNDSAMFFASLATGFKSGGFNSQGGGTPLGATGRIFAPEDSTSLDIGLKTSLLNGRLTANVALFRTEIEDFQDRNFDGLSFIVSNAGKVRQQGLEADVAYRPTGSISLRAGVGRIDSKFLSYANAPALPGSTSPQDLTGASRHFSPDWTASLASEWRRPGRLFDGAAWVVRADWQYVGEQNLGSSTNNNPQSMQASYALFNLAFGLDAADDRWNVNLYGQNVTDEAYCMTMFDQPIGANLGAVDSANGTSVQRCVLGNPATYGASYRRRF